MINITPIPLFCSLVDRITTLYVLCDFVQFATCTKSLYKLQLVQVAICTRWAVQVLTCTKFHQQINPTCTILLDKLDLKRVLVKFMPLFHQRIKPRSCLGPLIVGSLGKNGKKIDQWGGRQNRYEGLGLTTDRPQDAPGGPRLSPTGLGLRTD